MDEFKRNNIYIEALENGLRYCRYALDAYQKANGGFIISENSYYEEGMEFCD